MSRAPLCAGSARQATSPRCCLKRSAEPRLSRLSKNALVLPSRLAPRQGRSATLGGTTLVLLQSYALSSGCPTLRQRLRNGRPRVGDEKSL